MKVTVTPTGEVVVDADNPAEAAAFVRELHGTKKAARKKKPKRLELESTDEPLSQVLADTWNWLVENDAPEGLSATDAADSFHSPVPTVNYRLRALMDKGLAHQPVRGRYRAGEAR
jgi:hypothetical protein